MQLVLRSGQTVSAKPHGEVTLSARMKEISYILPSGEIVIVTSRKKIDRPSHKAIEQIGTDAASRGWASVVADRALTWRGLFTFKVERIDDNGVVALGGEGLRPPQIGALHAIGAHWSLSDQPGTIVMPTGTGKTETMLSTLAAYDKDRVLVISPSTPESKERSMSKLLAGKTALVTGASRGIGRAIAERLAADGAAVALTYNENKAAADEAVAAIVAAGGRAVALQADLADAATIPRLFEAFDDAFGKPLDILVNNAGNSGWGGLADATPDAWDKMIAVHARAPFFVVQSALDRLSGSARIINISSGLSTRPQPMVPIYSMAKAAINNLTHALAMDLGPRGVTVNAVAPGWVRTDMNATVRENGDMVAAIESDTALGRFGETADIVGVVAFLASDDGRWVTGQVIEASGGYRL
ncbi:hypothetical protein LTR94_026134 [Friedmanniomyces endolithicus]|nr:hypothetical protein LTR94_026134 [Friedmanniomyces endolithicus]